MTCSLDSSLLGRAAELLRGAQRLCVSTGAGMSAESGVPTFRDDAGLWSSFDVDGYATPAAFARDPLKVWSWYRWRREKLARCHPHCGHTLLAEWQNRVAILTVVTQNVDGLHHRAGSTDVIELHGRLDLARCVACPHHVRGLDDLGPAPRCPACGGWLRPGVVWFNEMLPPENLARAEAAAGACDVMLVIGTSGVVWPAAGLVELALSRGAKLIEINPNRTPFSGHAHAYFASGCGEALAAIDAAWITRA